MSEDRPAPAPTGGKVPSIQALRGIAAIAVVFNHSLAQVTSQGGFFPIEFFAFGVDLFFVISGFIMVHISDRKYTSSIGFIRERILRIYPMYFLFTTLIALAIVFTPGSVRNSSFNVLHYVLSILFIPHINPATLNYSPILRVGWTLNMEMYFYAIFALSMMISHSYRVVITAAFILLVVTVETVRPSDIGWIWFYSQNIVIEFVFGMVVARLIAAYGAVWSRGLTLVLALISVGFILLSSYHQNVLPRGVGWGVPSALLVWCALMLDRTKFAVSRIVTFAGDISYSLYLSHLFVISTLRIVWVKLHLPMGTWMSLLIFMAVAAVLACAVGAAFYKLLEEPMAKALRRFRSAPTPVQAAAV